MTNGSGSKPPQGNQPTQQSAPSPWHQQAPTGAPVNPFPQPGQAQPPMQQPPMQQPPMQQPAGQPMQQPAMPQAQVPAQAQQPAGPQPGQVPVQPSTSPAQPNDGGDPAFGFDAQQQPKEEKYNTLYLASNMQRERRRTQYIVIGIILFAIIGAILWVSMMPEGQPPGAQGPGEAVTVPGKAPAPEPAAPAAIEEPGEAEKADEAE